MNPISQMTQQELSNLPRALEAKPGMELMLAQLQGKLQFFPLQSPVSNLREIPRMDLRFPESSNFLFTHSFAHETARTYQLHAQPCKRNWGLRDRQSSLSRKALRFGNRHANITTRQCEKAQSTGCRGGPLARDRARRLWAVGEQWEGRRLSHPRKTNRRLLIKRSKVRSGPGHRVTVNSVV